jgi:hypothetical protein
MNDAFVVNGASDFRGISLVNPQNIPEVPADEVRLFEVLFRDEGGEDHRQKILAKDFWEAEMVSFGFVPIGKDYFICQVSDAGGTHVSYTAERRLCLDSPVEFSRIHSDFSRKQENCCGEW